MRTKKKWVLLVPLVLLGGAAFVALGGAIVRLLWNALLPSLFGWPEVGFWQALGLLALCRILFGGSGFHGAGRSGLRRRMADRCRPMTPEEREAFRARLRERWGFSRPAGESGGE